MKTSKNNNRLHRKRRIRAKVSGTVTRPRICAFRSLKNLYVQIIDDKDGRTLFSWDFLKISKGKSFNIENVKVFAIDFAEKLKKGDIKEAVFDRNGYRYHGKIKALAEGLREGGIKF